MIGSDQGVETYQRLPREMEGKGATFQFSQQRVWVLMSVGDFQFFLFDTLALVIMDYRL